MKPIAAALAVALMGMGGVALAAPKSDPGPPEQAQANGSVPQAQANEPAPQSQANVPAPQAQNPAPPPQAKAKGHQRATPVAPPPAQPPQAGGEGNPGVGQNGNGQPAPGETRGRGESRSTRAKSGACRFAGCRQSGPKTDAGASGGGAEQPQPAGGQPPPPAGGDAPGGSGERPGKDESGSHGGGAFGDHQVGVPELGSVLGANQGGGEEVETTSGSFDSALPFTGFEVLLLAGIGALLWLLGVRLRRATA